METAELEMQNVQLSKENADLREENEELKEIIEVHEIGCKGIVIDNEG